MSALDNAVTTYGHGAPAELQILRNELNQAREETTATFNRYTSVVKDRDQLKNEAESVRNTCRIQSETIAIQTDRLIAAEEPAHELRQRTHELFEVRKQRDAAQAESESIRASIPSVIDDLRQQNAALSAAWQQCRDTLRGLTKHLVSAHEDTEVKLISRISLDELEAAGMAESITPPDALAAHDRELRQELDRVRFDRHKAQQERDNLRQVLANLMLEIDKVAANNEPLAAAITAAKEAIK